MDDILSLFNLKWEIIFPIYAHPSWPVTNATTFEPISTLQVIRITHHSPTDPTSCRYLKYPLARERIIYRNMNDKTNIDSCTSTSFVSNNFDMMCLKLDRP